MKAILPTLFFLLSLSFSAQAQLETIYTNFYDDGLIDTLFETNDLIALSDGNFAVSTIFNPAGEINYSVGVLKLDATGKILSSFGTETNNENANRPWLSEGSDGSIWVAFGSKDESGEEDTRVIKLSADLSMVESDQEVDLFSGTEQTYGITAQGDDLFIVVQGVIQNDTSGILENAYNLYSLNPSTLATKNEVVDALPRRSFSSRRNVKIVPVGADRIAIATRAFDPSTGVGGDILVTREFMTSDLTQVADYMLPGIGRDSYSMDFEYLPAPLDAFAFTNRAFGTYLIRRSESPNTVVDTILPPVEGLVSNSFANVLAIANNSLLVLGRDGYRIDFDGAEVDTVVVIENFRISATRIMDATSDGKTILGVSTTNFSDVISTNFSVEDEAFQDTTILAKARNGQGVSRYWGGFTFPSQADSLLPAIGIRQNGRYLPDGRSDWGFRMIDAETGEDTDQTIGTTDISFWADQDGWAQLSPLVAVGDGFMASMNEFSRTTFFRFDKNLNALQPDSVGFSATERRDLSMLGDRITSIAPTSYGILGSTYASVNTPDGSFYYPIVFASDTLFQVRIDTLMDNIYTYPFTAFHLATDSTDSFYGVAVGATAESQFQQTDSVFVYGFASNDSLRYTNSFTIPDANFTFITKMILNDAQDELLISGTSSDSTFANRGFRAQVDPATGGLIRLVIYDADDLGYSDGERLVTHIATYDDAGNIVHTLHENTLQEDGTLKARIRMIQVDNFELILRNKMIYTHNSTSFELQNVIQIGESLYVSGNTTSISGIERSAYLIRVNTGSLVNTKDIEFEVSSKVFPNPTYGPITLAWENPSASDYQLELIDYTGRTLQQWKGNEPTGPAQINIQVNNLPNGIYFLRLGLESGFAVHPFVKH